MFQNVAGLAWPWLPLHSGFRSVPPALVFLSLVSYPEPALLFTVVKTKTVLLRAGLSRGSPSHLPIFHWPKQATWLSWTSPGQECLLLFSRGQTVKSHGDFGNSRGRGLRAVCGLPEGTSQPVGPGQEPPRSVGQLQGGKQSTEQSISSLPHPARTRTRNTKCQQQQQRRQHRKRWPLGTCGSLRALGGGRPGPGPAVLRGEGTPAVPSLSPTSVKWGERLQSHSLRAVLRTEFR